MGISSRHLAFARQINLDPLVDLRWMEGREGDATHQPESRIACTRETKTPIDTARMQPVGAFLIGQCVEYQGWREALHILIMGESKVQIHGRRQEGVHACLQTPRGTTGQEPSPTFHVLGDRPRKTMPALVTSQETLRTNRCARTQ